MPGTAIDGPEKMKVEVTALTVHSSESTFFRSEYITEALEVPADSSGMLFSAPRGRRRTSQNYAKLTEGIQNPDHEAL